MKAIGKIIGGLVVGCVLACSLTAKLDAQTNRLRQVRDSSIISLFTNNPAAMFVITNLLAEPQQELSVPAVSQSGNGSYGNFWTLTGPPVPLPFDPYPDLPVYQVSTNRDFIIDTRSVDFVTMAALDALEADASAATNETLTGCVTCAYDEQGLLWIEVPTNSLTVSDYFTLDLHNTSSGQSYDILTTPSLSGSWTTELVVTGAVGNITEVQVPMNNRTNLFVRARTSVAYSFYLISPPLSQDVLQRDTVTFSVETGGKARLALDDATWEEASIALLFSKWQQGKTITECMLNFSAREATRFHQGGDEGLGIANDLKWELSGCWDLKTIHRE
jgi:hypothetical protein